MAAAAKGRQVAAILGLQGEALDQGLACSIRTTRTVIIEGWRVMLVQVRG
jgi:hypothetical protein